MLEDCRRIMFQAEHMQEIVRASCLNPVQELRPYLHCAWEDEGFHAVSGS